jgi:hypothetical protein
VTDLAYPKDDPSTVDSMVKALSGVAGDLDGAQQRLMGHSQGLRGVWKDDAGSKATAELDKLGSWVHKGSEAMQQATAALGPYKSKLVDARERIDKLRTRQTNATNERNSSVQSTQYGGMPQNVQSQVVNNANTTYNGAIGQINQEYEAIMTEVRTAAGTAAAAIGHLTSPFGTFAAGQEGTAVTNLLDGDLGSLHDQHMREEADKAAALAKKAPIMTDEELKQLAAYSADMKDPAFATEFMNKVGPDGLLYLGASLGKMKPYEPMDDKAKARLASLKSIQQMLGTGLATATNAANSSHVDDAWINKLKDEGKKKIDFGSYSFQPYGYQVLGNLLKDGDYSKDFLTNVGGDMYDFEKAHPGVWDLNKPQGAMYNGYSLDLVHGGGFDPATGLMTALAKNPDASKAFFTADDPSSPDGRLNYYLTKRIWGADDLPSGTVIPKDHQPPGLDQLGNALDSATTINRDATSARLMEGVVHDLGNAPHVHDKKFGDYDAVPPAIRDSMGHMIKTYIGDAHNAEGGSGAARPGIWNDPALPNDDPNAHAFFNRDELNRIVADTAKDPDAYKTIYDAEKVYTALAMDAHAKGIDANGVPHPITQGQVGADSVVLARQDALKVDADRAGGLFGALEYGHGVNIDTTNTGADADYNGKVDAWGKAGSFVVDKALGKVPIPGVGTAADKYIDALIEGSKHDSTGTTNFDVGQSYGHSRDLVQGLSYNAMYDNNLFTGPEKPPADLYSGGHPIHYEDMTPAQQSEYNTWITGSGQGSMGVVSGADDSFIKGVEGARQTLAPKHE